MPHRKKAVLPQSEWAFHLVPEEEICACAQWELGRHQGGGLIVSDRGGLSLLRQEKVFLDRPWLDLPITTRRKLIYFFNRAFIELPVDDSVIALLRRTRAPNDPWIVCAVGVDFSAPEKHLVKQFKAWLRGQPRRQQWLKAPPKIQFRPFRPPPNRPSWENWLFDIACYRAVKKGGLVRKKAIFLLDPLIKKWKVSENAPEGRLSAPHFSRALRRAESMRDPSFPRRG